MDSHNDTDVIIIGAGAAGLMAGHILGAAGKRAVILEAQSRIGGRIHTASPPGFTDNVELGAEFIHGDLALTMEIIRKANLRTHAMAGQTWNIQNKKVEKSSLLDFDWGTLMQKVNTLKNDMTLDKFIQQHLQGKEHLSLVSSLTRFVEGYDAADPKRISMFALRDEWSDEEPPQYRIEGGYQQIIEWLRTKCEESGVQILLNQKVCQVHWQGNNVEVKTDREAAHRGSCVIVTIPLGVLVSRAVDFIPGIPDQLTAAEKIGVGGVIKFLAEFKTPVWEMNSGYHFLPNAAFIFSDAPIPTWWTQRPNERPLLTGWLSGPKAFEKKDTNQLRQEAIESLSYLLGCHRQFVNANLRALEVMNWIDDPYVQGAYSYATPETVTAKRILNTPVGGKIYFAGEALYEGKEMGTVEAALWSGKKTAEKVVPRW